LETHASTEMVGQVAAAAGVKTVVLTHLIPYREPEVVSDDMFKEGVRKYFSGEIIVGKDLMSI
jgi:ribonuclease BN (tRNA processing enzyme)